SDQAQRHPASLARQSFSLPDGEGKDSNSVHRHASEWQDQTAPASSPQKNPPVQPRPPQFLAAHSRPHKGGSPRRDQLVLASQQESLHATSGQVTQFRPEDRWPARHLARAEQK